MTGGLGNGPLCFGVAGDGGAIRLYVSHERAARCTCILRAG